MTSHLALFANLFRAGHAGIWGRRLGERMLYLHSMDRQAGATHSGVRSYVVSFPMDITMEMLD